MLGTLTVGVDDTGHDVKFFGATSGAYMQWDESVDDLLLGGAARIVSPIGIFGADNNAGGTVSIASGDSGATANSSAAELVVENNGTAGMSILTFNNTTGNIYFGDGQDNDVGKISYNHSSNALELSTNGAAQWSLDSSGNFLPAATDHGIYLGVTSATAANLLDDYEEGTWTPTWSFSGGGSVSYSSQNANYTKVGRLVTCQCYINTGGKSSPSGTARLAGLPFTTQDGYEGGAAKGIMYRWNTDFDGDLLFRVNSNDTLIQGYKQASNAGGATALEADDFLDGTSKNVVALTITYSAA